MSVALVKHVNPLPWMGIGAALFAGALPSPAVADPVSFTYRIDVTDRCTVASGCVTFKQTFPLVMSFDADLMWEIVGRDRIERGYGQPTFSDIPLERPAVLPGAWSSRATFTTEFWTPLGSGFDHVALAQRGNELHTDAFSYDWRIGLSARGMAANAPSTQVTPAIGAFLGRHSQPGSFLYLFNEVDRHTGRSTANGIAYLGRAVLVADASSVPEPTSLLLLASGMCGLCAWRRRRPSRAALPGNERCGENGGADRRSAADAR